MLSAEVFKNIDFEGFEFINVDDNSEKDEIEKDELQENKVIFLENKKEFNGHSNFNRFRK